MAEKQISQSEIHKSTHPAAYMLGVRGTYKPVGAEYARVAIAKERIRIVAVDLVHGIAYCEIASG